MESFGRISLFPGFPLASSKFFGLLDLICFSVSDVGFAVFTGCSDNGSSGVGFQFGSSGLDVRFLDFQGLGSKASGMFGFFGFF